MKISFDNEKYLKLQSENILNRVNQFGDKLYIEFGGKLFDDYHASRVLPGFEKDTKLKMRRAKEADIIIVFLNKEHFEDLDSIKGLLDSLKR